MAGGFSILVVVLHDPLATEDPHTGPSTLLDVHYDPLVTDDLQTGPSTLLGDLNDLQSGGKNRGQRMCTHWVFGY